MATQIITTRQQPSSALENLEDLIAQETCSVEQVCQELARIFHVRTQEVALLQVENLMLKFLYPAELRAAGAIPLNSSAVAARTANTRRADFFNNFVTVQHSSIFESVKFPAKDIPNSEMDPNVIQKMMSAPVFGARNRVTGVLQISKKAFDLHSAGPDFNIDDLELLREAARVIGVFLSRKIN